jgi:16S rRNA (adenine1518-N6/adenine1519-N6)-dimethyltransferase
MRNPDGAFLGGSVARLRKSCYLAQAAMRHGRSSPQGGGRDAPPHPRKSLGQHFLADATVARRIASELSPRPGDCILEIGPGTGALTRFLAAEDVDVIAVDIDTRVLEAAAQHARAEDWADRVRFLHGDATRLDITALAAQQGRRLRVCGNLPYNITSPLLFHVVEHRRAVTDCVFMVQREVAQRLVSPPGSREYGIPSVFCQLHADLRLAFHVPPGVFHPPPAVWSSVFSMRFTEEREALLRDYELFRRVVRTAFGQRRKMLSNSLRALLTGRELPGDLAARMSDRPERLSVEDFIALANALAEADPDA